MGEINDTLSKTCVICESGKYSLNPSDNTCKSYLSHATCYGRSNISIEKGYWRKDNQSENIIQCEGGVLRCNGGIESSCTEQFTGPVCLQCNTAFGYIANNGDCSLCAAEKYVVNVGIIILSVSIAYQIYTFVSTYKDSNKTYIEHQTHSNTKENLDLNPGAYISILTTYAQVRSLFSKWIADSILSNTLEFSNTLGNPNQQILFSLQCFLFYIVQDSFEILRFKVIIFTLSPLVKASIIFPFIILRAYITKEENKKNNCK